jgi:hypothetical protein
LICSGWIGSILATQAPDEAWLSWTAERAEGIGRAAYVKGRVGGWLDTRILTTERSYNYKLAATWLTPDVIRATARLEQLRRRLDAEAARRLVAEAESTTHTAVMVEIDPREGAGVIPNDWLALLQFDGATPIAGSSAPALRQLPALAGVLRRNYDYDRYWLTFPLIDAEGRTVVPANAARATLIVRIYEKEGRVTWTVPSSFRDKVARLSAQDF